MLNCTKFRDGKLRDENKLPVLQTGAGWRIRRKDLETVITDTGGVLKLTLRGS
jgi:hypothetical protein